ncbi:hypothetical protein [Sphingomonas sp.]|jgi:hypothetical protein|uniref:hypothetical protein n=1 Tax=Sphingomonas sp. TaxID=28214 RepID=UPI002ED8CE95
MTRLLPLVAVSIAAIAASPASANDFPTEARADYVIGCMAANGQTQDTMRRCACSIDAIAAVMPYRDYERAETVMRMRGMTGETASLFRDVQVLRNVVDRFRAAQVEADFRCF